MVHRAECPAARKLLQKDAERFITVEWSDEPTRAFDAEIVVTVRNGKGVLAKVAGAIAAAEGDITHIDMEDESAMETTDLRFVVAVRDEAHLDSLMRSLRRTPHVLHVRRAMAGA
jgi:GTP pyrophosphokinase